jgi:hypothetical protein
MLVLASEAKYSLEHTARQRLQSILLDAVSDDNDYSLAAFHTTHVTHTLPWPPINDLTPQRLSITIKAKRHP